MKTVNLSLRRRNRPHREPTLGVLAIRGIAGTAGACLVLALLGLTSQGALSGAPTVTARLDNVGASLSTGADVKARGVIVGKVTALRAGEDSATLTLTLDSEQLPGIPANVVARVLPATVFGNSFVDLAVHGPASVDRLAAGDIVGQDQTQGTLEFQQALDDVDSLVKALGPAELNAALGAVAEALDGRGTRLGQSIDLTSSLLRRMNRLAPDFRRDMSLLADNLEIVAENAPQLLDALQDGLVVAQTLVAQREQLTALLTGGLTLVDDADRLLARRGEALALAIAQTAGVIDATYDNRRAGILGAFRANSYAANRIPTAVNEHGQLVIEGGIQQDSPPFYTAADCPTYGSLRGKC